MIESVQVFVFRDNGFARSETVVNAAPLEIVVSVYGGGGMKGAGGLEVVFGGAAYFHNDETGVAYLGVWGSRNGGSFRTRLRQAGIKVGIVRGPPPARLKWFTAAKGGKREEVKAVRRAIWQGPKS